MTCGVVSDTVRMHTHNIVHLQSWLLAHGSAWQTAARLNWAFQLRRPSAVPPHTQQRGSTTLLCAHFVRARGLRLLT